MYTYCTATWSFWAWIFLRGSLPTTSSNMSYQLLMEASATKELSQGIGAEVAWTSCQVARVDSHNPQQHLHFKSRQYKEAARHHQSEDPRNRSRSSKNIQVPLEVPQHDVSHNPQRSLRQGGDVGSQRGPVRIRIYRDCFGPARPLGLGSFGYRNLSESILCR